MASLGIAIAQVKAHNISNIKETIYQYKVRMEKMKQILRKEERVGRESKRKYDSTLSYFEKIQQDYTSGKWEISDQINDQNPHINNHFWFDNRWWVIYGLLLRDQNWSFLFWSFIACELVIYLVIYLVINLVIYLNQ